MEAQLEHRQERGQVLIISAFAIVVMLMITGLILDGGFGLAQRRVAQNGADLAALAGARVIASFVSGDTTNGTDANVVASINTTVGGNNLPAVSYGAPDGPRYVDIEGNQLAYVGTGAIPAGTAGVTVKTTKAWKPFFAGLFGVSQWSTQADATARGGYRAGGPPPGSILPIGVSEETYTSANICPAGTPTASCTEVNLTEGELNIPGGFGWLKFGCGDSIDDFGNVYGLGQTSPAPGCEENTPFLEDEWGNLGATPPVPPNTYGCCTEVGLPGSGDDIGSLPGNKVSISDSTPGVNYYISTGTVGFVPIWDEADGNGSNGYYHIIGFAGFQITHVNGSKEIQGILRQVIFPGPVGTEAPGFAGAPLATQLIR